MKIVLLGLIVVALIDGIVAAPRDNDNHLVEKLDDSKSEFETILAQLQQLQAQLNDQQQRTKEQQHQMEEQQDQIKEQQHRMEVQQQRNEEQQRQMKAFMQINRARQSDTETGITQCAVGNFTTTSGATNPTLNNFDEVEPISYGRTFSRVPTVVTSIAGFERGKISPGLAGRDGRVHADEYNIEITVYNPAVDKFDLGLRVTNVLIKRLEVTWIACA